MTHNQIKLATKEGNMTIKPVKILCVDDEEINLEILKKHLNKSNYDTVLAENGEIALKILSENSDDIDIILLDRMMPNIDGMEVLKKIKENPKLRDKPVIMQTAAVSSEEIEEGIEAGAYYYITKPYTEKMLISVVANAARDYKQFNDMKSNIEKRNVVFFLLKEGTMEFHTLEEARSVANYFASFSKNPPKVLMALTTIMTNAVEHGNLEIGEDTKGELISSGKWEDEIDRRLSMPQYKNRKVILNFERKKNSVLIHVKDEGNGFNWKDYMNFLPSQMKEPNGRSIAIANITNPECLKFLGCGNEVVYTIKGVL